MNLSYQWKGAYHEFINSSSPGYSPKLAIEEIVEFLPRDSAAAIKKLGAQNPLVAILIILTIINSLINAAGGIATAYRALNPSAPIPSPVINNNITITNPTTTGHGGDSAISKPIKSEQARRLKQIEAKKEKLAREGRLKTNIPSILMRRTRRQKTGALGGHVA